MKTRIGTKVWQPLPNGTEFPATAIGEETTEQVEVVDQATGLPVTIDVTRNEFISLRTRLADGEEYLALTSEVVMYGRRIVATPRFEDVVGLDMTEDGKDITLAELTKAQRESRNAFNAAQFEQRRGASVSADAV